MNSDRKFYVYVLFDRNGQPFYIGKGHGNRWLAHDRAKDPNNRYKNFIVRQTIKALGEIPKVKIRDGLSEPDAFDIEAAFIKAIGRYPHGPLVNQTDNRNGPSSETIAAWHAGRTPEKRKVSAAKTQATKRARYTPEQLSEIARRNALSGGSDAISSRMKEWHRSQDPEIISKRASAAGKASSAARTTEDKRSRGRALAEHRMATTTPEQRRAQFKKGLGAQTVDQLRENGKKGAAKLNKILTPEQRSAASRKSMATRGPEAMIMMSIKGARAIQAKFAKKELPVPAQPIEGPQQYQLPLAFPDVPDALR